MARFQSQASTDTMERECRTWHASIGLIRISSSLADPPRIAILFTGGHYEILWTEVDGISLRHLDEDGTLGNELRLTDEPLDWQSTLQWVNVTSGRLLARETVSLSSDGTGPTVTGHVTKFDEALISSSSLELPSRRVAIAAHRETVAILAQPTDRDVPFVQLYRVSDAFVPVGNPVLLQGRFGYASISATSTAFFVALWQRGIPEQIALAKLDHRGVLAVAPRVVGEGLYPEIASGAAGTIIVFGDRSQRARDAGLCGSALSAAVIDEDDVTLAPPVLVGTERGGLGAFEVRATPTGFQVGADFVVWYRAGSSDASVCLAPRFAALDARGDVVGTFTPSSAIAFLRD